MAFWLQLESASSAAVCVGTLALPTRGLAYEKALYRIAGTVIGVIASIVIAGLFGGVRDLFVLAVSLWMAACVYVASLLEGNRSYGAVLSGFTVAIVAVANVDSPARCVVRRSESRAAIIIGVVAVMLFSDLFAAPNVFSGLLRRLEETHRRVIAFAHNALHKQQAEPQVATDLLRTIVGFRAEITALPVESIAGSARLLGPHRRRRHGQGSRGRPSLRGGPVRTRHRGPESLALYQACSTIRSARKRMR